MLQARIDSKRSTSAQSTLVVGSDTNIIGSDKLNKIEINGPAVAGFLPRQNTPYLTVSVATISGSDESLFQVGRNIKMTWGSSELHIRSPIHVAEYGTLTLPEAIFIENGGVLDICGTLSSDTGNITMRDGGELRISDPATALNVFAFFVDYQGNVARSTYCTSGSGKVTIQTTYYNKTSDFTLDTSYFTMSAANTGELTVAGEALTNRTCNSSGSLELKRNQFCELDPGTYNYDSITIHPGAELRIVGDEAGTDTTTIRAAHIDVMFLGKITAAGTGYKTGGPGSATSSSMGATHGGSGIDNTKSPYGNVRQPMTYGSNGNSATSTTKRGGGQIKLDVSNTITIDGEIDASGQETASGGSIYILSPKFYGFGTIHADGGAGGGGGGRISVSASNTYDFTGTYSAHGGDDSSGNPTSSGLYMDVLVMRFLSRLMRKPTMWFPNRSDTNQSVQAQKMARGLKFWIQEEEGFYFPSSENKGADQLRGYCEADLRLCFRLIKLLVLS